MKLSYTFNQGNFVFEPDDEQILAWCDKHYKDELADVFEDIAYAEYCEERDVREQDAATDRELRGAQV